MKAFKFLLISALIISSLLWADDDEDFKVPPRGKTAYITVVTDPPNSDVYLGGEHLGKSPIKKMKVKSGRQTLVVLDQGYELVNERFNVWPDSNNVYQGKTVIPKGHVSITTVPSRCRIQIDGDEADHTDGAALVVRNLDAGDHVITAICGRRTKQAMVTIEGEKTAQVTINVNK